MKKDNWFKSFYNTLIKVSELFSKKDIGGKLIIIRDLLFLIIITCLLKIPFIFIRDVFDSIVESIVSGNMLLLSIWALLIEFLYVILALLFFKRTLARYVEKEEK